MTTRLAATLALALTLLPPAACRAQDEPEAPAGAPSLRASAALAGHRKAVHGVAFSPDGKLIASAGEDAAILWDASTKKLLLRLDPGPGGRPDAYSVAFDPDGKTLAVGGYFGDVYLWDVAARTFKAKLDEPSLAVYCLAYSPDGSVLAATHDQAEVMLFDPKSSKLLGTIKPAKNKIKAFAFSADGKTLAGITDYELSTWDVATRALRKSVALEGTGVEWSYLAVACAPKGATVVASGGRLLNTETVAYDLKTLKPLGGLEPPTGYPSVTSLRFSPDGAVLATTGQGNAQGSWVGLWNVSKGTLIAELTGPAENLNQVAFSPDGRRVVAAGFDKAVHLWNLPGGSRSSASKARGGAKSKKRRR